MASCGGLPRMGKLRFYGKEVVSNKPLFVAMDFEQYQIARVGMMIATSTAVILGISMIVMAMKKKRRSFI